jgi:hypothetical protein
VQLYQGLAMASNRNDSGPRDRTSINMNDPFEVRYWSKELGVSLNQLKAIVGKVGSGTDAIRAELGSRANRAWHS